MKVVEEGDLKPVLPKKKKLKGVDQPLAALKIDKVGFTEQNIISSMFTSTQGCGICGLWFLSM